MSLIELKKIKKEFSIGNTTTEILKETDLLIEEGEFVAIVGPSGSGKSTLLTIMGALQSPSEGQIIINNREISQLNRKEQTKLRFEEIGFVLQASNLVPFLTIKEQFELKYKYKKEKVAHDDIKKILVRLSIEHIQDKYPDDVSGGERQRAAIGLALIMGPKIILADEPTASLDTEKAYEVIEIFQKISKESNTTILMVTHDVRMLSKCDRVLEMKDGYLSEITKEKAMQ